MAKSKITVDKDTNVPQPDNEHKATWKVWWSDIKKATCVLGFHAEPLMEAGERQQITYRCPRCKQVLKVI